MDEQFMQQALQIAGFAAGRTSPNPLVGAVIVKDSRIVGQGWHRQAGTPHAEIHALNQAGNLAQGATLYVTLEPCNHHGRTGPCTEAVIQAGIKRVFVSMLDPNPLVAGKGVARLREAGIEVNTGILAVEAARQNEVFIKWITTGLPFTVLKAAMTLDGKIATASGQSQWITGAAARQYVHELRDRYDAILVGIGTVLADQPRLTTRLAGGGKNPVRVVVDSLARTPPDSVLITDGEAPTWIAVSPAAPPERVNALRARGTEVLTIPETPSGLDLRQLFSLLGQKGISSVLVEGGAQINASVLAANLADKVYWFIAPKLVGGNQAPGPVGGGGILSLEQALRLEDIEIDKFDEDILLTAYLAGREGRDVYRTCGRIGQS